MKNLILSILTLFILTTNMQIFSQNNYPFPDSNAIWNIVGDNVISFDQFRIRYGIYGDTIINSKTYQKIYDLFDTNLIHQNSTYFAGLRNEDNKVYVNFPGYNETLLYDFTLVVGDTIWYEIGGCATMSGCDLWVQSHWKTVVSIDTVTIENGDQRKRWHLEGDMGDKWIEGIGSIQWIGLFNPLITDMMTNGDGYNFACFKQNDQMVYLNNPQCEKCFCQLYTFVFSYDTKLENNFTLFPNPTEDRLQIKSLDVFSLKNYDFELLNIHGQIVKEEKNIQTLHYSMNVGDFIPGVYFYIIKENGVVLQQGKLIKK